MYVLGILNILCMECTIILQTKFQKQILFIVAKVSAKSWKCYHTTFSCFHYFQCESQQTQIHQSHAKVIMM